MVINGFNINKLLISFTMINCTHICEVLMYKYYVLKISNAKY